MGGELSVPALTPPHPPPFLCDGPQLTAVSLKSRLAREAQTSPSGLLQLLLIPPVRRKHAQTRTQTRRERTSRASSDGVTTKAVKTQRINNIWSGAYPREALSPSVTAGAAEEKTITRPALVSPLSRGELGRPDFREDRDPLRAHVLLFFCTFTLCLLSRLKLQVSAKLIQRAGPVAEAQLDASWALLSHTVCVHFPPLPLFFRTLSPRCQRCAARSPPDDSKLDKRCRTATQNHRQKVWRQVKRKKRKKTQLARGSTVKGR